MTTEEIRRRNIFIARFNGRTDRLNKELEEARQKHLVFLQSIHGHVNPNNALHSNIPMWR